ncbi:hypothetical protein [Pseudovibrio sp. WM33]|uniref:hypothetical protein n=1 Tax=Pseudovibrio sp. WM33 TaxID=1735585 RepID=UPI0007AECCB5|nr:hypothetical protein [Pseudovibrio sp. WM33]KZL28366.1 hypothetical protein PsWM33_00522 [Pseudovibrio sp. WM33]
MLALKYQHAVVEAKAEFKDGHRLDAASDAPKRAAVARPAFVARPRKRSTPEEAFARSEAKFAGTLKRLGE